VDALDHASPETLVGGKLGIECTGDAVEEGVAEPLSDEKLLAAMQALDGDIAGVRQYFSHTKNPVAVVAYRKNRCVQELFDDLAALAPHLKILVVVDEAKNDIDNPYMLVWRVANNLDAQRDVRTAPFLMLDATDKNALDGYTREWPGDVMCDGKVLESLKERGVIDYDEAFARRFYL